MSDRLLVATRKGLFWLAPRATGWEIAHVAFAGSPVSMVMRDPRDAAVYAALNLGHFGAKLHRSDDDGRSWKELAPPAFPAGTAGEPSLAQIWTIEAGAASQPGRLWVGAIPAGLFRSDDRGDTWQLVEPLWNVPERANWLGGGYDQPGIHSISNDPRDPRRTFIAISCGGVWDTCDDGASWRLLGRGLVADYMPPEKSEALDVQDPHRVARCAADPDVMWMQHHNGVFRSIDAGATWTRLTPAVAEFGFAVAAHPTEPGTAWFVPAIKDEQRIPRDGAIVVNRTRDGGESWETLREGLPQRDAYDLVYRHGLAVDATGTRLAMGSTTGSLWTSHDGGERWTLVNAHLPPIYAVRFA